MHIQTLSNVPACFLVCLTEWDGRDGASGHVPVTMPSHLPPLPARHKHGSGGVKAATSLDELTNRIFDDLMKGKSEIAHGFDELGVVELDRQKVSTGSRVPCLDHGRFVSGFRFEE